MTTHELGGVAPRTVLDVEAVAPPEHARGAWWLELDLQSAEERVSRNVYWLSTQDDVLDRSKHEWHSTGVSSYADFSALEELRRARVEVEVDASTDGDDLIVRVTLRNEDRSGTPAVTLHPSIICGGEPVVPVFWDDSDVTLFAGQSATLTGRLSPHKAEGLTVHVDGLNLHRPLARIVPIGL